MPIATLGGTFTNASANGVPSYIDQNGVVRFVNTNVLRNAHYINGVQSTLLEAAATNRVLRSGDLSNAAWTARGTAGTSGKADPSGGTLGLEKIVGTAGVQDLFQNLTGFTATSPITTSFWVRVVAAGTGTTLKVINPSDGTQIATFTAPATGGAWTRVSVTFNSGGTGGGGVQFASGDGSNWTVQLWGVQQEAGSFASSYIPTAAAVVTRAIDSLTFPWGYAPRPMTVYIKGVNLGTAQLFGTGYFEIGNNTEGIIVWDNAGSLRVTHRVGAALVQTDNGPAPAIGATYEIRAWLNADGSIQSGQSINGAAENTVGASAANAFTGAWGVPTLRFNAGLMVPAGFFAFQSLKIVLGAARPLSNLRVL